MLEGLITKYDAPVRLSDEYLDRYNRMVSNSEAIAADSTKIGSYEHVYAVSCKDHNNLVRRYVDHITKLKSLC